MNGTIGYQNYDDFIKISRTDLIEVVRDCELNTTLTFIARKEHEGLISDLEDFEEYGSVVRILKPESKKSVETFFETHSGIMIVPGLIYTIQYAYNSTDKDLQKVMIGFNTRLLNTIIQRILRRPVEKHANDFMDSLRYYYNWENIKEDAMLQPRLRIKDVIFNDPATIVFWYDGTKTVVKCQEGDEFDPEKGLAMAICKKILGSNKSQSNFNDIFKKWLPKEEKIDHEVIGKIKNMRMTEAGLVVEGEITDPVFGSRINEFLGILGE